METAGCIDKLIEDVEDILTDEEEKLFFDRACKFYFAHKSLISHHLDSYNQFLARDICKVFKDAPPIKVKPTSDKLSIPADGMLQSANISFGRVTMHKPEWTDKQGNVCMLYPTEARLRKMSYSASIYADINVKPPTAPVLSPAPWASCSLNLVRFRAPEQSQTCKNQQPNSSDLYLFDEIFVTKIDEEDAEGSSFYWKREKGQEERTHYTRIAAEGGKMFEKEETLKEAFVGKVPVMVMSDACHFSTLKKESLIRKDHCLFDGGGYFIINGSEKGINVRPGSVDVADVVDVAGPSTRIAAARSVLPTAEQARWDVKDAQAHALIALSVKRTITPHIRSAKSAKQTWDILAGLYAGQPTLKELVLSRDQRQLGRFLREIRRHRDLMLQSPSGDRQSQLTDFFLRATPAPLVPITQRGVTVQQAEVVRARRRPRVVGYRT
ncbi:hypothetical protein L7F22_040148 [Adiantum nelumboides]|nr:hypothetical protein [Adiantum nelumboides]